MRMLAGVGWGDPTFPTPALLLPLAGRVRGRQPGLWGLESRARCVTHPGMQLIATWASFQRASLLTLPACDLLSKKTHPCQMSLER